MATTHNLGFPRIGDKRQLKFSLEAYWRGDIEAAELQLTAQQIRTAMRRSAKFPRVLHHTGFGHGVLDTAAFLQEF